MIISTAHAQPFGGPSGCCGGGDPLLPDAIVWIGLLMMVAAVGWPWLLILAKRLARSLRR
ncbi:hypothetical protein SAMN05216337_1017156 [Bradyrhizobium brasilense]|uniref:Uncharacterized protein n=1 Tax=Bradyrhizobium brasilense TaxID=1419277 RepID=A0A1G6YZZ7_9BRAD|nr:hypothetical protein [Bradyrhizobium brasilense]SDD95842.1 hypothetical protein SAMN05216337_1017156 [Bradyrhizobium brasilense]